MSPSARAALGAGAIAMFVAVAAGAFGAHALRTTLSPERLAVWQTAVQYQAWHALALLAVGVLMRDGHASRALTIAAALFIAGIVVFSGSLYLLVLADARWLGAVTPLGGAAFLAGWAAVAFAVLRAAPRATPPSRPRP